jgi:hypothetical protein
VILPAWSGCSPILERTALRVNESGTKDLTAFERGISTPLMFSTSVLYFGEDLIGEAAYDK